MSAPMDFSVRIYRGVTSSAKVSSSVPFLLSNLPPSPSPQHLAGAKFQATAVPTAGTLWEISRLWVFREETKAGFPFAFLDSGSV